MKIIWLFVTPWTTAHWASLSFTICWSLLKLMSIQLMMPSNNGIPCPPLLLLPSIFPSIRVFSKELTLHIKWPKYCSFSNSPSSEYSGVISFRMDGLDLLDVQGTLKSLLQHHSLKTSILQQSAFFTVQLSHPYVTTGKTIVLTIQTFVGKVMSLLSNMLSRLVFSSKEQASFNFLDAVTIYSDFGNQENKICFCFHCSPSICHEVMEPDAMILVFWMLF